MLSSEQLNDILDKVGNTPIEEPELFKALDEKTLKRSEIIAKVLERSDLTLEVIEDMPAHDVAEFFWAIARKITEFRDGDGNYKTTPATESFRLPNFFEVERVNALMQDLGRLKVDDVDGKLAVFRKLDDLIWEITQLSKDDLTVWEQELVQEQVMACVTDVELTSMGKPSKN